MKATVVAVVVAGSLLVVPAAAHPASLAPQAVGGQWVTLVTGDQVLVRDGDGDEPVTVRPAEGRGGMLFRRSERRGEVQVIPADAEPMVAAGKLDRALFNVTRLIRRGHGDRARADIPLTVNGQAIRAAKAEAAELWKSLRSKVDLRVALEGESASPGVQPWSADDADVTMVFLDHHGRPTDRYSVDLADIANPNEYSPFDPSGTVVARLPKGEYFLRAHIQTDDPTQEHGFLATIVHEPTIAVNGDVTLTFDARQGKRFGATVDRPNARRVETFVGSGRTLAWGFYSEAYVGWSGDFLHVRPSSTTAPAGQFEFRTRVVLGEAGKPYLYNVRWSDFQRVPTDLMPRIRDRDLAVVHTRLSATAPNRTVGKLNPIARWAAPARLTEYYTPGVPWYGEWGQYGVDPEWPEAGLFANPRMFRVGKPVTERWFAAVFGPAFPAGPAWVGRKGDGISVEVLSFVDQGADRYGGSAVDSGRTVLYRDGVKIAENGDPGFGYFTVPPEPATYRLEAEATRSISALSSRVGAAWTFRSGHVTVHDPKQPAQALSLMAVRFAPATDDHNRAPGRCSFSFPVYVQLQDGAEFGRLVSLDVQVSYDDGASWTPVRLTGDGLNRTAYVQHPGGGGFVSLRASAADSLGNSVEQTIIHAYALRP